MLEASQPVARVGAASLFGDIKMPNSTDNLHSVLRICIPVSTIGRRRRSWIRRVRVFLVGACPESPHGDDACPRLADPCGHLPRYQLEELHGVTDTSSS